MNKNEKIIKHSWASNTCINCGLIKKVDNSNRFPITSYSQDGINYEIKRPNCIIQNETIKLKDKNFAVIAEKRNGIVNKWVRKNIASVDWNYIGEYYVFRHNCLVDITKRIPTDIPIYTETQLEALIKAEENPQNHTLKLYL